MQIVILESRAIHTTGEQQCTASANHKTLEQTVVNLNNNVL